MNDQVNSGSALASIPESALIPPSGHQAGQRWRHGSLIMIPLTNGVVGVVSRRSVDSVRLADSSRALVPVMGIVTPYAETRVYDALFDTRGAVADLVDGVFFGERGLDGAISRMVIALSGSISDLEPAYAHESLHYLKRTRCLNDEEYAKLRQSADAWIERFGIAVRYPADNRDTHIEESIAEAFASYAKQRWGNLRAAPAGRRDLRADSLVADQLAVTTDIPRDAAAIFDRILSGEIGRRYPAQGLARDTVLSPQLISPNFRRTDMIGWRPPSNLQTLGEWTGQDNSSYSAATGEIPVVDGVMNSPGFDVDRMRAVLALTHRAGITQNPLDAVAILPDGHFVARPKFSPSEIGEQKRGSPVPAHHALAGLLGYETTEEGARSLCSDAGAVLLSDKHMWMPSASDITGEQVEAVKKWSGALDSVNVREVVIESNTGKVAAASPLVTTVAAVLASLDPQAARGSDVSSTSSSPDVSPMAPDASFRGEVSAPKTLAECMEALVSEPDHVRAAWLALEGARHAAQMEAIAGSLVSQPPPPLLDDMRVTLASASAAHAKAMGALRQVLEKIYANPKMAEAKLGQMLEQRKVGEVGRLLTSAPMELGEFRGGTFWNRGQRREAESVATSLPAAIRTVVSSRREMMAMRNAISNRAAEQSDPARKEKENMASALRDALQSPVTSTLPITPPPAVSLLSTSPGVPAPLSYRLAWHCAAHLQAMTAADWRRHEAPAVDAEPTVPADAVAMAKAWHGREERISGLERDVTEDMGITAATRQFNRAIFTFEKVSSAQTEAISRSDPVSAAHAAGIAERADHCATVAAGRILAAAQRDPEVRRELLWSGRYPEYTAVAERGVSARVPSSDQDDGAECDNGIER